jgi:hypothetical protein
MSRALSPCIEDGCYFIAINRSRCEEHQLDAFATNDRASRLPRDWAQRRKIVLNRDRGVCYVCGGTGADSVDHVIPNDDNSLENLAAIHQNIEPFCHRTKTAYEGIEASKANRPARSRLNNYDDGRPF